MNSRICAVFAILLVMLAGCAPYQGRRLAFVCPTQTPVVTLQRVTQYLAEEGMRITATIPETGLIQAEKQYADINCMWTFTVRADSVIGLAYCNGVLLSGEERRDFPLYGFYWHVRDRVEADCGIAPAVSGKVSE